MSSSYIDTPFDNFLIFEINGQIKSIFFRGKPQGAPLSGELRERVLSVFESKDFSFFDYSLLDITALSLKQLMLHDFLIGTKVGELFCYSDVAQSIFGNKRYARAVARLLSLNRFAFFVPCHRVVAKNGMGGYSSYSGVELKSKILLWEGVDVLRR